MTANPVKMPKAKVRIVRLTILIRNSLHDVYPRESSYSHNFTCSDSLHDRRRAGRLRLLHGKERWRLQRAGRLQRSALSHPQRVRARAQHAGSDRWGAARAAGIPGSELQLSVTRGI